MFPEVNNLIGTDTGELSGKYALLLERGSDSSFVLHHFLSSYLKQGMNVCLVLLNQSFSHYNSIGNKLSVSLTKAKDQGQLLVIEGLKDLGRTILCPQENSHDILDFSAEKNNVLKPLFLKIKAAYDELSKSKPTLIIIDDISVLLSIGVETADIFFLTKYLGILAGDEGGILTTLHCAKDDDEADLLSKQMQHLSDVCIEIQGLASGYCKDVHGQIKVTLVDGDSVGKEICKRMQFRVFDKTVSFFAVGTSGAVL